MTPPNYDPDRVDWMATFKRNEMPPGPIRDVPPILVMVDGSIVDTTKDKDAAEPNAELNAHLKRRLGRPPGSGPNQRAAAAVASTTVGPKVAQPSLSDALPAGDVDDAEKPEAQESVMSKPRTQTLPGVTGTAAIIVRELPLEAIHEAIERNHFENGVEIRVHYKNNRGTPIFLGRTQVSLEALLTDLEEWLRVTYGGGCFRVDTRDPATGKRALPIPVFEVNVHAPPRLMSNGTVLAPGQTPNPGMQGSSAMSSGFQAPWLQGQTPAPGGFGPPLVPGSIQTPQTPWLPPAPGYGGNPNVHHVPVMSMPPDAIAMTELQKAQTALERERIARAKEHAEFTRQINAVTERLNEQSLKEQDRARQLDAQQMREQMRRMEEDFRGRLEQDRNRRPTFDLAAFASVVAAVVPVLTAMVSSRSDQAQRSLEMQAAGVNNLMKATLDRTDSKWVEKMLALLPTMLPLVTPIFKAWAEQRSPTAQADLVATLSENHLTSLSMMAKFLNEMTPSGPDTPAWVGVFQQMVGTIVGSIDSMVKSNKSSVGLPVQSRHLPVPGVVAPAQAYTPAQIAAGMHVQATQPPIVTPVSRGVQIAQLVANSTEVPEDLKTPAFLKLIEDLHNEVSVDEVALYFANLMRELEDNVPQLLQGIWKTDDPENLLQGVFSNLPIWQWNMGYTLNFIRKAVDILTTPESGAPASAVVAVPAVSAPVPTQAGLQFFTPVAAPA
jgi:hypothetical protein